MLIAAETRLIDEMLASATVMGVYVFLKFIMNG
jgi:hypothetical protein